MIPWFCCDHVIIKEVTAIYLSSLSLSLYFVCTCKWSWKKLCFREAESQCLPHKLPGGKTLGEAAVPVLIHWGGDYRCRSGTAVQNVPEAHRPCLMCQSQKHTQGYSLLAQCALPSYIWTAKVQGKQYLCQLSSQLRVWFWILFRPIVIICA